MPFGHLLFEETIMVLNIFLYAGNAIVSVETNKITLYGVQGKE